MNKGMFLLGAIAILLVGTVFAATFEQTVTVNVLPSMHLEVYSPADQAVYPEKRINLNMSVYYGESAMIEYADLNLDNPRWRVLCRGCTEYGLSRKKSKTFSEGQNLLGIRITKNNSVVEEKNISFLVDSISPRILGTEPKSGFASGVFEVQFKEDNPVLLELKYGEKKGELRTEEVDLNSCIEEKNKRVCEAEVDVSDFDGQELEYWFELTDIIGTKSISKSKKIDVDVSDPVLNNPASFWTQGEGIYNKYVYFELNISEQNFDEIIYIDRIGNNKWKVLSSSMRKNIAKRKITFRKGDHDLSIRILDKAGNMLEISDIVFSVK